MDCSLSILPLIWTIALNWSLVGVYSNPSSNSRCQLLSFENAKPLLIRRWAYDRASGARGRARRAGVHRVTTLDAGGDPRPPLTQERTRPPPELAAAFNA